MPVNPRLLRLPTLFLLVLGVGMEAPCVEAQPSIISLYYSLDTASVHGSSVFADEDVVRDNLSGSIIQVGLGPLPSNADLNAYHRRSDGIHMFSLDVTVELPGLIEVRPSDVVSFDGTGYALAFSGMTNGIPTGACIDAFALASNGDFLISFDVALDLPGLSAEGRDLLRWNGSSWTIFFDGADAGVPDGLNLDAAHVLTGGARLLVSFDGSGTVGGIQFNDEDVMEFDLVNDSWSLFWDGSSSWSDVSAADLDALSVLERPSAIFADGFESGNLSAWSGSAP